MHNFDRLRGNLSKAALRYWVSNPHMLRHGVMNAGRYESFIPLFSRAVGIVQGKKRVEGLFLCETLEKQQADFDSRWSTVRWRLLFKLDRSQLLLDLRVGVKARWSVAAQCLPNVCMRCEFPSLFHCGVSRILNCPYCSAVSRKSLSI